MNDEEFRIVHTPNGGINYHLHWDVVALLKNDGYCIVCRPKTEVEGRIEVAPGYFKAFIKDRYISWSNHSMEEAKDKATAWWAREYPNDAVVWKLPHVHDWVWDERTRVVCVTCPAAFDVPDRRGVKPYTGPVPAHLQ